MSPQISPELVKKLRSESISIAEAFPHKSVRNQGEDQGHQKPESTVSSYLWMRDYQGDVGIRPIPQDVPFWISPDIELLDDASGQEVLTSEVKAGGKYSARVTVHNNGNIDCQSCQVELFICDPSIGFNLSVARPVGLAITTVPTMRESSVILPMNTGLESPGHRCLFARAFSVPNNDLPSDLFNLDAAGDRHVAQKNLFIAAQGTVLPYSVHLPKNAPGKGMQLELLVTNSLIGAKSPPTLRKLNFIAVPPKPSSFSLHPVPTISTPNLAKQLRVPSQMTGPRRPALTPARVAVPQVTQAALTPRNGKWALPILATHSSFQLSIPNLGLKRGEAHPVSLILRDPKGRILGGIGIIIIDG